MIKSADIAVIGSGVVGASVAYFNARAGAKVILIDKGDLAEGTSSKSDGNILICDKMPGFDVQLAKASQDMFPQLSRELDFDIQWHQRGSLYLVEDEEQYEIASKFCADMAALGMPMRMMDKYEIHQDEPYLAEDLCGGLETACDGSVYPMGLCYGFALSAQKLGAELLLHSPVTGIDRDGSGFVVHSEKGDVAAKNVVDCAGIWSPAVGKMVGLELPIQARQGQILVSEQTFKVARRKVHEFGYMLTKFGSGGYKRKVSPRVERNGVAFVFEPTASNNFLIGSSRSFVGEDISCDIEVMQALAERAIRFFPVIRDIKVIRGYSGLRPFTPDHLPIISDTPVPGFYIAAGHEGDGIGLAPITGRCIADLISGKKPFMDLSPVSYGRFLKN